MESSTELCIKEKEKGEIDCSTRNDHDDKILLRDHQELFLLDSHCHIQIAQPKGGGRNKKSKKKQKGNLPTDSSSSCPCCDPSSSTASIITQSTADPSCVFSTARRMERERVLERNEEEEEEREEEGEESESRASRSVALKRCIMATSPDDWGAVWKLGRSGSQSRLLFNSTTKNKEEEQEEEVEYTATDTSKKGQTKSLFGVDSSSSSSDDDEEQQDSALSADEGEKQNGGDGSERDDADDADDAVVVHHEEKNNQPKTAAPSERVFPETQVIGLGVHPWWTPELMFSGTWKGKFRPELIRVLEEQRRLSSHSSSTLVTPPVLVGEIGLDKYRFAPLDWRSPAGPYEGDKAQLEAAWDAQVYLFADQLAIASEFDLPVSVHCVRAFGPMLDVVKDFPKAPKWWNEGGRAERSIYTKDYPGMTATTTSSSFLSCDDGTGKDRRSLIVFPKSLVFHGFTGSVDFAKQMLKLPKGKGSRIYFGFGPLHTGSLKHFSQLCATVPKDRVLLESDVFQVSQQYSLMHKIATMIAAEWRMSVREVIQTTTENTLRAYGFKK